MLGTHGGTVSSAEALRSIVDVLGSAPGISTMAIVAVVGIGSPFLDRWVLRRRRVQYQVLYNSKIGLDTVVVQGTSDQALAAGSGHYPQTPLPCSPQGNVGIAGHRTMNGHPFQRLDQLAAGDKVILTTPFQTCTYQILASVDGHANPYVTDPNDWTVIAQTAKPMLTMSTCTPEGTARQRLVARAQLVSATNTVPGASVK